MVTARTGRRVSGYLRQRRAGKTDRGYCYFTNDDGERGRRYFRGAFDSAESRREYTPSLAAS